MPTRFQNTSLTLLAAALDQLNEGVIVTDTNGVIQFVNRAAEVLHGVKKLAVEPSEYSDAYQLLTMEGEPYPFTELPLARAVLKHEIIQDAHWRIRRPDGTEIIAIGTARPVLDEDGEQAGAVLTLRDDTRRLEQEKELAEAVSLKEVLLYEVNHRVKNSLQLVSSLINMQSRKVTDEFARLSLRDLRSRVRILAGIHERLYETGDHEQIEIVEYLRNFLESSLQALMEEDTITFTFEARCKLTLPVDKAVAIALALNELMLNSLKHAFAETEAPVILVRIMQHDEGVKITYCDNGCGISEAKDSASDNLSVKGIGMVLINSLTRQLNATIVQDILAEGYGISIEIPISVDI